MNLMHQSLRDPIVSRYLRVGHALNGHRFDQNLVLGHRSRCPETPVQDALKPDTTVTEKAPEIRGITRKFGGFSLAEFASWQRFGNN